MINYAKLFIFLINITFKIISQAKEQLQELEEARLAVSHTLQSCLQSDGRRRYATPPQQIAAFNRRSQPELQGSSGGDWMNFENDIVVGNDVSIKNVI